MHLALFDFDGTITDREMFIRFLQHAAPRARRLLAGALLSPLYAAYKLRLVGGDVPRIAAVRTALAGMPLAIVQDRARSYASDVLPQVLRPEAMARIDLHRRQGHAIAVVTGALELAVAPWCAQHGLDLIGSVLEVRNGVLTGRYAGAQCVRAEKARRVRERYDLAAFEHVHAYGDTPEDRELLALAQTRVYRWQPQAA
jgi:HAD superfamily hydrolase (TIGR01490 family)